MNGPGHQFFSGATLTLNHDGGISRRDILDELIYGLHLRILADDTIEFRLSLQLAFDTSQILFVSGGAVNCPGGLL